VLAGVLGLPVELCVALGYVSVLGSATNTFFAPVFMGIEVFGTRYIPWFAVVSAIAYICNGKKSVYSLQK
jgi:H+/Cl- antiporter ClcA